MPGKAPRLLMHMVPRFARGAWLALAFAAGGAGSGFASSPDFPAFGLQGRSAETTFPNKKSPFGRHESWASRSDNLIIHAGYFGETSEYGHFVLGPLKDAKSLAISVRPGSEPQGYTCPRGVHLPDFLVFEGVKPILADVTGDGMPEIITTVSSQNQGARVSLFDRHGETVAHSKFIGTRFRWLGLIGASDLDRDGRVEIAYIDRPHLAKTLRLLQLDEGRLVEVASLKGLTNHRIGEDFITGGIRHCGETPEIITADASWRQVMATRFVEGQLETRALGPFSAKAIKAALEC